MKCVMVKEDFEPRGRGRSGQLEEGSFFREQRLLKKRCLECSQLSELAFDVRK